MGEIRFTTDKPEHDMHSCFTCREKYRAMEALNKELVEALEGLFGLVEQGELCRNVARDNDSSAFITQGLTIVMKLKKGQEALRRAKETK